MRAAAADLFLDSLGNPNTVRNYGIGVGKIAERIGENRPLGSVADDEIGEALELLWDTAAVNTWNARRASVLSWLGWCAEYGYDGPCRDGNLRHAPAAACLMQQRAEPLAAFPFPWSQRSPHHDRDTNTGISIGPD